MYSNLRNAQHHSFVSRVLVYRRNSIKLYILSKYSGKKNMFWMWPRNTVNVTVQNCKLLNFSQQFHSVFLSPFLTGLDAFCDSYTVSCMTGVHHLQALTSLFSTDCCVLANPLRFLSELHFPVNWPFLQCCCLFFQFSISVHV